MREVLGFEKTQLVWTNFAGKNWKNACKNGYVQTSTWKSIWKDLSCLLTLFWDQIGYCKNHWGVFGCGGEQQITISFLEPAGDKYKISQTGSIGHFPGSIESRDNDNLALWEI